ncbi:MAG: hypothetical protein K5930_01750 [Treponemataceae bacterium]|nr:hypothetical protein [Treponemataceae bacterium]
MNENEFNEKNQFYRQRRARNVSIAVMGYFIAVICLIGCTVMFSQPIMGVIILLLLVALSTGLIIYTRMSTPLEFTRNGGYDYDYAYAEEDDGYRTREVSTETDGSGENAGSGEKGAGNRSFRPDDRYYKKPRTTISPSVRMFRQVMEIYWILVTIIYFVISFSTMKWYITWIIWLIGAALDRAIRILWDAHRFDNTGDKR